MGLLSSLKSVTQSVGKAVANVAVVKPANAISNLIKKGSGTATVEDLPTKYVNALGLVATATGAALAAPFVPKAAKALVPKTPKQAVVTAIAAPAAVGVLSSSPTARNATIDLVNPVSNLDRGKAIGEKLESLPDKSTVADIATKGLILGTGAALATGAVIGATKLIGGKEKETPTLSEGQTLQIPEDGVVVVDKSAGFNNQVAPMEPTLPQTEKVTNSKSKKRRKSRRKAVIQPISNKVNVKVENKNYINKKVLYC